MAGGGKGRGALNRRSGLPQTGKAFSSLPSVQVIDNEESNQVRTWPSALRALDVTEAPHAQLNAPVDFLIGKLTEMSVSAPPGGVYVGSTDVLLQIPAGKYEWCGSARPLLLAWHACVCAFAPVTGMRARRHGDGITGLAIPAPKELGRNHGVYRVDADGQVSLFLQKPTIEQMAAAGMIRKDGTVLLDSGRARPHRAG
jgi:hypothetical protein